MPTDAPHLARQAAPIAQLMSPVLWLANKPDRFDSYSAGAQGSHRLCSPACLQVVSELLLGIPLQIFVGCAGLVLMQLALPKLRTPAALKAFNKELADADFDLDLWRRR